MSSDMSYRIASFLLSPKRNPRPIDCSVLILLLLGEAKITLCKLRILIPVENVPYDATIIAFSSFSVILRTSSRSSTPTAP